MSKLSQEELEFFDTNGYVVVRNVVPKENAAAAAAAIWAFLEMDPDDSVTWYQGQPRNRGMVDLHQHQALWDNRQHPSVYELFSQVLGRKNLWVTMDRCNMKPPYHPAHPEHDNPGFVHWDIDITNLPSTFGVQGVLFLTDTTEDMGGFHCIPGIHKILAEWVKTLPPNPHPYLTDLSRIPSGMAVTHIAAQAGDMVIWDRRLAHGNGSNLSSRPRLAQYLSMTHALIDEDIRQHRIAGWRERRSAQSNSHDPRNWEKNHYGPAELTPLGRKLLGVDLWWRPEIYYARIYARRVRAWLRSKARNRTEPAHRPEPADRPEPKTPYE